MCRMSISFWYAERVESDLLPFADADVKRRWDPKLAKGSRWPMLNILSPSSMALMRRC